MFVLDARLQQDSQVIGDFPLCRLLLSNDANYPWFILVPRREEVSELFHLEANDLNALWEETNQLSELLKDIFAADKMNVAALGNVVSQLHMHVIVRYRNDPAWPAPVWGKVQAQDYQSAQLAEVRKKLRQALPDTFRFIGEGA